MSDPFCVIKGAKENVESAEMFVQEMYIGKLIDSTQIEFMIPSSAAGCIIGKKGAHLLELQEKYGVDISVPRRPGKYQVNSVEGSDVTEVELTLRGNMEDMQVCQQFIQTLVARKSLNTLEGSPKLKVLGIRKDSSKITLVEDGNESTTPLLPRENVQVNSSPETAENSSKDLMTVNVMDSAPKPSPKIKPQKLKSEKDVGCSIM